MAVLVQKISPFLKHCNLFTSYGGSEPLGISLGISVPDEGHTHVLLLTSGTSSVELTIYTLLVLGTKLFSSLDLKSDFDFQKVVS